MDRTRTVFENCEDCTVVKSNTYFSTRMEMLQFLSHFNYHDNQSTITITGETMTSNNGHFFLSFDFSVGNFIKPFAMK